MYCNTGGFRERQWSIVWFLIEAPGDDEIKGGSLGGEDRWGLQEVVSDEVYCADRRLSFMDAGVVNRDELCQVETDY
nr:hypothetical protein [uncultured bacterium]